jgi:hypothetical protein
MDDVHPETGEAPLLCGNQESLGVFRLHEAPPPSGEEGLDPYGRFGGRTVRLDDPLGRKRSEKPGINRPRYSPELPPGRREAVD